MFLKPANSDTENGIKKFPLKKIRYSGNWKRHFLKCTRTTGSKGDYQTFHFKTSRPSLFLTIKIRFFYF